MKPQLDVLDKNLRLLLKQAYVPALPRPEFRARLERELAAEISRRRLPVPRRSRPLRLVGTALALAAGLLVAFLVRSAGERSPDRATFLAAGQAVWSADESGWFAFEGPATTTAGRPLPAEARSVVTPKDAGLTLIAGAARLALSPDSALSFDRDPLRVRLTRGSVDLRAEAALLAQLQRTTIELERGHLRLDELGFELVAGQARVDGRGLPVGQRIELVGGRLPELETAVASVEDPRRTRLADDPSIVQSTSTPSSPASGTLSGTVALELGSGAREAVSSYRIVLLQERAGNEIVLPIGRAFENADGRFSWDALAFGSYGVFVDAGELAFERLADVVLDPANPQVQLELTLARAGELSGFVVDEHGDPIEGAFVVSQTAAPSHGLVTKVDFLAGFLLPVSDRTRADGSFLVSRAGAGEHRLLVTALGFAPIELDPVEVRSGERTRLDPIELHVGGSVSGQVTDADGAGRSDVQIIFTPMDAGGKLTLFQMTRTDADGRYRVDDVPAGISIGVAPGEGPDGWSSPKVQPVVVESGSVVELSFLGHEVGTDVRGHLRDAEGLPLKFCNMAIFEVARMAKDEAWKATTTDSEGRFRFEDTGTGPHAFFRVEPRGPGLSLLGVVDITENASGEPTRVELAESPFQLTGRVVDAWNSEPIAHASVHLEGVLAETDTRLTFAGTTQTDADGVYSWSGLPPGTYNVTVVPVGKDLGWERSERRRVGPDEPEPAPDVLRLFPGGRVSVTVVDSSGSPLPQAYLTVNDESGRYLALNDLQVTGTDGSYVFENLRPGKYEVGVQIEGRHARTVPVEAHVGTTTEITVELKEDTAPGGN